MKKYILKSLSVIFALTLLSSCLKEAEITTLGVINYPQTFRSSTNSLVMTADNDSVEVIDFTWDAVSYGITAAVTYSLQFDLPSDTAGATAWSKAIEIAMGDDILTKGLMGYDINKIIINGLGLDAGVVSKVVVRVKSYVDRPAYSNVVALDISPYTPPVIPVGYPSLWVAGDFQAWKYATAPTIVSVPNDSLYEGYIYIPAGGTLQYKYYGQPSSNPVSYGDGGSSTLVKNGGANFTAPSAGYYELSGNLKTMKWTATKTTWSILGDATPGGWTTDTQMDYDVTNQVWKVTADMKTAGSFKFRANNAWKIDFGIDSQGNLVYVDNPLYPYNPQSNITVPSDGNYTLTLDLHIAGQYSYKLKKN